MGLIVGLAAVGLVVIVAGLTTVAVRMLRHHAPPTPAADSQTAATPPPPVPAPDMPARPPDPPQTVIDDPSLTDEAGPESGAAAISETTGTPLNEARTYLPNSGFKYTYSCNYPDGTSGTESETVGRLAGKALVTVVRTVHADDELIFDTVHFTAGKAGVVRCWDDPPSDWEPYMPNDLKVGQTWVWPGMGATVKAMNQFVDLGFVRFDDAMLVDHQYEADYEETMYYVPGYGVVLSETPGGQVARKLVNVTAIDDSTLLAIMAKHAPHLWQGQ